MVGIMLDNEGKRILNYPGSKWRLAKTLVSMIPEHQIYLEPFFGSGALYFNKEESEVEIINDLDKNIYNFYNIVKENPEKLAADIYQTPYAREIYDQCFEQAKDTDEYEELKNFVIKCWQGHGFRTNGYKVGWKSDIQGRERMYALVNWNKLPEKILKTSERLQNTIICNQDALELIEKHNDPNVFMYLDPPYVLSTRSAKQYAYEMDDDVHRKLLALIKKSKAQIMISGYDSDLYEEYLEGWDKYSFSALAEHGKKRREIIWVNYKNEANRQKTIQ